MIQFVLKIMQMEFSVVVAVVEIQKDLIQHHQVIMMMSLDLAMVDRLHL